MDQWNFQPPTPSSLGDHDVPNALVWIDKYTQIPRILAPILAALEGLDEVVASAPGTADYIGAIYGDVEACRKAILRDFFRHAFDGSGQTLAAAASSSHLDAARPRRWHCCASRKVLESCGRCES